jgi:hypothetical protein
MLILKPRPAVEVVEHRPRPLERDPDLGIETDLHRHRAPGVHLAEPEPPPDVRDE